MFYYTLKRDS